MAKHRKASEIFDAYSVRIVKIAIPVIICLVSDAFLTRFLEQTTGSANLDRSFVNIVSNYDGGVSTGTSLYTAIAIVVSMLVVTAILVALYYFNCIKVILVWMILATSLLFSFYLYYAFMNAPEVINRPFDYISIALLLLNIVVVGDLSIFWKAPQLATQVAMMTISVLVALIFLQVPDWTVWTLLALLIFYDMFVVLCPNGLLKILIEKSEERGDAIPALLYSSASYMVSATNPSINESLIGSPDNLEEEESKEEEDEEERGIKLGLGDFIFYGILVTRAARLGWDLAILDFFAVILGLSITLLFLAILGRPLPALPFSLFLGMIFFVVGALIFRGFWSNLRQSLAVF